MTTHRSHPIGRLLVAGLVAGALVAPAAVARPGIDPPTSHGHSASATPYAITFSNPLGRSRGPGAGGGLL